MDKRVRRNFPAPVVSDIPLIELATPRDWQDLQQCVCRIFCEIGLEAVEGKTIKTPRGTVNLDVYAIDNKSVDKVSYVVECKNWQTPVPKTVVHAFTTVLHEVGANIGYIISKKGLQSGAVKYTKNTNIRGMSYEQFQRHYFAAWFQRFFVPGIGDIVDPLSQYIEPFNETRDKAVRSLSVDKAQQFQALVQKYTRFGMAVTFFEFPRYSNRFDLKPPQTIQQFVTVLEGAANGFCSFKAKDFRGVYTELITIIEGVTAEFDAVFDRRPFEA